MRPVSVHFLSLLALAILASAGHAADDHAAPTVPKPAPVVTRPQAAPNAIGVVRPPMYYAPKQVVRVFTLTDAATLEAKLQELADQDVSMVSVTTVAQSNPSLTLVIVIGRQSMGERLPPSVNAEGSPLPSQPPVVMPIPAKVR